ncbi:Rieske [2Fe-2S] domain protein [Aspergillus taichungensis]|uniref:Rieske [2Fe-2S] domain protein n=1 Tax=Aspergillus taichungensis TaxID=482145 RepID=A0A2J5I8U6_9EURO|nr:Rieske [2Fe-2S] domain protein [Aspergillus taichungensis]
MTPVSTRRTDSKMSKVDLGSLSNFTQARYVIHLSTGKRIVLFRLPAIEPSKDKSKADNETDDGWSYYAMEAECPHAGGPMQDSQVDIEDSGYIVSCPWHAYDFNVETGESSVGITACTFPVNVRGDSVILHYIGPNAEGVTLKTIEPVSEQFRLKKDGKAGAPMSSSNQESAGDAKYLDADATLCDWCAHILNTPHPEHKIELTAHLFATFSQREGTSSPMPLGCGTVQAPAQPPRQGLTEVQPWNMPRAGRGGTLKSRISMLHALANIELWAIDLAIDICIRFATFRTDPASKDNSRDLPRAFYHDWLKVANDEAKHFSLLRARIEEMGSHFGALPVHHGLWDSATITAHDLRARISIIALVHEARGLDVNPMTIEKFRKAGDNPSVDVLEVIHNDEITHVTTGHRWLTWICQEEETDPVYVFRSNVEKYFKGHIKEPFNMEARAQAGMDRRYYENLEGVSVA